MAKVEIEEADLKALQKTSALYDALQTRVPALEAAAGRVTTLEAEIGTFKTAAKESAWTAAGITDPKVRRIFEMEHEELAIAGGEADLGKYLGTLKADPTKAPAHLAPFLGAKAAAPVAGTAGNPAGGKLPDTNAGARSPAGANNAVTAEQISAMTPAEFTASLPALTAAHPALAQFPTLPGATAPTTAQ